MKSKHKFFGDEDNVCTKKKDKFGNSKKELMTDKYGNVIRIGDFVQASLKDGSILNDCEIIDITQGNILTLLLDDKETTKDICCSKVALISI